MSQGRESGAGGVLTLLFTDIDTTMSDGGGDGARELVAVHDGVVSEQVEGHGGRVIKSLGAGMLVSFTSARRAVTCAAAIQRRLEERNRVDPGRPLQVRIGINAGEVLDEFDDLFGVAVNAAARIAAKAAGGEVLVAEVVKQLAGRVPEIDLRDRGRFRLKGFDERWRLYEVIWQREKPTARPQMAKPELVGRDAPKAELLTRATRAIDGHGSLVMIGGEAGVGKTRLTTEVAAEAAARGMLVLTGRCYEMEGAAPFIPFLEILETALASTDRSAFRATLGEDAGEIARIMPELRRLFDDIGVPLDLPADQARHYLFQSFRDFVARTASVTPVLLVYEDLHWADEPTLLLVEHLARTLVELPVLVIGTYRDVDLEVSRPLARTLENLVRRHLSERVSLQRLPEPGVEEMLKSMAGQAPPPSLVAAVYAETQGNPFFVEEVFQYLAEENRLFDDEGRFRKDLTIGQLAVPESIRLVVGRRLERLGEVGRKVLAGAAVLGKEFNYRLLAALGETDEETLLDVVDEAERAHLLEAIPGSEARFSFAHELIRQTLLTGLSLPRRQRLHLRVAAAIETVYGDAPDQHLADLAHHLYQAGDAADVGKTVRYLLLAADRAIEAAAFEDALVRLDDAGSLDVADPRLAADIARHRGLVKRSLGFWQEATAAWDAALTIYEEIGDGKEIASLAAMVAEQMAWATRWEDAIMVVGRGLAACGDAVSADHCVLRALAGLALSGAGNYHAGLDMIQQAESMAAQLDADHLKGRVFYVRCIHHVFYMEFELGRTAGYAAAGHLRRAGDDWLLSAVLGFVTFCCQLTRYPGEALALQEEGLPLATRLGNFGAQISFSRQTAFWEFGRGGDLADFGRRAREDLEVCQRFGSDLIADSHSMLGLHLFYAGNWDAAVVELRRGADMEPIGAYGVNEAMWMLAAAYAGKHDAARDWIEANRGQFARPGQPNTFKAWMGALSAVEALWLMGDREACAEWLPVSREVLDTGTVWQPFTGHAIHATIAVASAAAGEWDAIDDLFAEAAELIKAWPEGNERFDQARIHAELLLERNRPADKARARDLLAEAITGYQKIGMPRHLEMAKNLLART